MCVTRDNSSQTNVSIQGNLYVRSRFSYGGGRAPPPRGCVRGFSDRSKQRLRKYARCCAAGYTAIATLTWPASKKPDTDESKRAFRAFIRRYRRLSERGIIPSNFSMLWVREYQANGTPHYHLLLNHYLNYKWIALAWYQCCATGDANHLRAGTSIEKIRARSKKGAIASYLAKYLSKKAKSGVDKTYQHVLPDGVFSAGRWWGVVGMADTLEAEVAIRPGAIGEEWAKTLFEQLEKEMVLHPRVMKIESEYVTLFSIRDNEMRSHIESVIQFAASKLKMWSDERRLARKDEWVPPAGYNTIRIPWWWRPRDPPVTAMVTEVTK